MSKHFTHALAATCGWLILNTCGTVFAQDINTDDSLIGNANIEDVGKIGFVHDNLRRSEERHSLYTEASDLYDTYSAFKLSTAKDTGLSWAMDLSYMPQWGRADGGSPAGQWLAAPSVNWKLFEDSAIGSGSIQLAYAAVRYSTKQNATDVQNKLGLITPINDAAVWQNAFAQLTYTHTLPGEQLAIAIGQYSFFNFDSNDYLADQQLNFVNSIFSENASSTYAVSGVGAYAQFNANDTLQFLFGGQSVNEEDSAQRPHRVLGSTAYSWLAYAQWKPGFRSLGEAQYSLGIYQASAIDGHAASRGWSINAMQNLSDRWAVFGRLNASHNEDDNSKRSAALGLALNNPLGRSAADQIGTAWGKKFLFFASLYATPRTRWRLTGMSACTTAGC